MIKGIKIKLFADGADLSVIEQMSQLDWVDGFTTNPTLIRKAGTVDYKDFAEKSVAIVKGKPISFEVFADELEEMLVQARIIASWGENVYVKIPVTNTKGESTAPIIKTLSHEGIKLNVTAVFTVSQVQDIYDNLKKNTPSIISIFAGRVADTGRDPMPLMQEAKKLIAAHPQIELLWASPREVLNVMQAVDVSCDIITATPDILNKLVLFNKDLNEYSLETVKMFYNDAQLAGYKIEA